MEDETLDAVVAALADHNGPAPVAYALAKWLRGRTQRLPPETLAPLADGIARAGDMAEDGLAEQ